ncbi:MAG: carbon storage regulator CsrA [Fervidobacterium sp.]|nr:carbon storage regulator CsrA [Fervidobacterium gondwanense]UXF01900.1 carbon storage regulator CsrA [Fervidobacterium riparium]
MLVLSRKVGESILIGDNIQVKVIKIENGVVKIGIMAPSDVKIYREEIYSTVAAHNKAALGTADLLTNVMKLKEALRNDKDR